MISIRSLLLLWLLPGFIAVCAAAGVGSWFSAKHYLEAKLDARLSEEVAVLRVSPQIRGERGRPEAPVINNISLLRKIRAAEISSNLFAALPDDMYCETWIHPRGVRLKSDSLEGRTLPPPKKFSEQVVFYDAELEPGRPLRIRSEVMPGGEKTLRRNLLIGVDRSETDKTLSLLAGGLCAGGTVCCLALVALLAVALRTALRPLCRLGEQAATIDASSLGERFPEDVVPADIRPIVLRLNSLLARLEESFARERRFSGDIAHELRTPLASIRTVSEVAAKWPEQSSPQDFQEITALAAGLQQTLDSLLLLARMESAQAAPACEPVLLAPLVDDCRMLYETKARSRNLRWTFSPDADAMLKTDPRLLKIIVANLIANAVEYAPENSEIIFSAGGGSPVFQCVNPAPELSEADLPHLTERLWRKDAARTESGHAGLGLAIVASCAGVLGLRLEMSLNRENMIVASLFETGEPAHVSSSIGAPL